MAGHGVVEFTTQNWEAEVAQSDRPVVVDFWATWCGPCRALTPTIEKLATQFAGKVKIGKLNIDENPEVAEKYSVTSIPRLLFFKGNDTARNQIVGLQSQLALEKEINRLIDA